MNFSQLPALTLTAALALGATAAQAVEVTGGSVGLSYSAFTEDTDLTRLGLEGSVEFGFTRNLGLQIDTGYSDFGVTGVNTHSLGLHGIYHLDEATSFGAFYTEEDIEGFDLDIYGLEVGHEANGWNFEGYIAQGEVMDTEGNMLGFKARHELANDMGLTGSYDRVDSSGVEVSRVAVRLDRDVAQSTNLFVEVGSAKAEGAAGNISDPFVGLGGTINFGAARGATFDVRNLSRLVPGL